MITFYNMTYEDMYNMTYEELYTMEIGRPPLAGPFHFKVVEAETLNGEKRLETAFEIRVAEVHS